MHTYAYKLREVAAYLGLESPLFRCGKSTLLDILGLITNRALRASNVSSPSFFRTISEVQPTLLIDETDTFLDSDELRGILNSGYRRKGAFVLRVVNDGPRNGSGPKVAKFCCWCPKAIAHIGRLSDTLRDRCIVFVMQRKLESEESGRLSALDPIPIRRKCMRFVLDHAQEIASARPKLPPGLNDRAADLWEPLLAIANLAGGHWPELARQAAVALSTQADETSPATALLLDLFSICLQAGGKRIFSRALVAGLNAMTERPWAELRPGKKVTETWLARQLRDFGVQPRTMWIDGVAAKGYLQEELEPIFRRYLPKDEVVGLLLALKSAQKKPEPPEPAQ